MKSAKSLLTLAAILTLGSASLLFAQEEKPQEPSTTLAMSQKLQQEEIAAPEAYRTKIERESQILEISLRDAIRLALTNNLDIAIEDYSEDMTRENILLSKGFYDPALSFQLGYSDRSSPTVSELDGTTGATTSGSFSWATQLDQNLPRGGSVSLSFSNFRNTTNNSFQFFNPLYGGDFQVDFRQPLWRGYYQTQTERLIRLSNLDLEINDLQFESIVADVLQRVQNQYWELVFAIRNYETRRQGMLLAILQHTNNQKRVQIGVSAPIEITSSRAEVAGREQEMISSEVQIINAENALKRMLSSDPNGSIWSLSLIPTDLPTTPSIPMQLDEAIQIAVERRPELKQIDAQVRQNAVNESFYRKELKPTVDLRASFSSTARTGSASLDGEVRTALGGIGDAIIDPFRFDFTAWSVFADVRIPLGNRTAKANLAQAQIQERRNLSRLKDTQQAIVVDVRNAFQSLKTQQKALEAAQLARKLSEEQLAGENKRFQAGLSTNFQVLRFQRDLTTAEASELRAVINYEQAVTNLRRATYTIIDQSDIVLAKGSSDN